MTAANIKQPKALPPPDSDFYQLVETLPAEDLAVVKQVRAYMETKVQPIINKYWAEDAFPFELLPSFKELNIGGLGMEGYGCRGGSQLLVGLVAMEMSRVDSTTAKRDGDTWILNGQKRWIGNSPWCDISVIWARDVADNQVKAFIVENKTTPGF